MIQVPKWEPLGGTRNLLINGDFQINQREQGSYSGDKYSMDMWYIQAATLTIISAGNIKLSGGTNKELWQFVQGVTSNDVTFALKVNGSIYTGTATNVLDGGNHDFAFDQDNFYVRLHNNPSRGLEFAVVGRRLDGTIGDTDLNIEYIDLFEGSIAYPHVKEDYAIALMRCQEWLRVIDLWGAPMFCISSGQHLKINTSTYGIDKMIGTPTVTINPGSFIVYGDNTSFEATLSNTVVRKNTITFVLSNQLTNATFYTPDSNVVVTCSCEPK